MTVPLVWPQPLRPWRVMFHPQMTSRSGGATITGDEQIVQSDAGRWRATLDFSLHWRHDSSRRVDQVLLWRTMLAKLQGRAGVFLIGPYDRLNSPGGLSGVSFDADAPWGDGSTWSDGSEWGQSLTPAEVVGDFSSSVSTITIGMLGGHTPETGQYFGIGNFLYLISGLLDLGSDQWSVTFWPPLRENVVDGTPVEFDEPVCQMRFADDATGQMHMQRQIRDRPTIDVVEVSA